MRQTWTNERRLGDTPARPGRSGCSIPAAWVAKRESRVTTAVEA